jgi:small GTP-binding protein
MTNEDNYDMILKLVLIGDSFVGKTNIMSKYLKNEFHEDSKATVGVEFGSKKFEIEGVSIKAQIWDTAGQERYKSITNAYYKGSKGAFIVYDITRKETFDSVDKWISDLKQSGDKKITILLIGNKNDLDNQRQISKEQGEEKAKSFGVAFLETSAFNGYNLDKAFDLMIKEVYDKCHAELDEDDGFQSFGNGEDISLAKGNNNTAKKKDCC